MKRNCIVLAFFLALFIRFNWISQLVAECQFPSNWTGIWFQSGEVGLITVNATTMTTRGNCIEHDGAKYLLQDREENCFRCLVIIQNHFNILQFKETYCLHQDDLEELCGQIAGDAPLIIMYRVDGKPIPCPFKGGPPFTFVYNRGSGDCKVPLSRIDECTDSSRMLLKYQACPDIRNSESTMEELVCMATWKEGRLYYMIGKYENKMLSDEERYRCFVYSKSGSKSYELAQSADATCNGVSSSTDGSKMLKITEVENGYYRGGCRFPSWLTDRGTWYSLDNAKSHYFSTENGTLYITNGTTTDNDGKTEQGLEMRAICKSIIAASESQIIISAHVTVGCQNGFKCMAFYYRDSHIVEMQLSNREVRNVEEACLSQNLSPQHLQFTILVPPVLNKKKCPYAGLYYFNSAEINTVEKQVASASVLAGSKVGGGYAPLTTDSYPNEKGQWAVCDRSKRILSTGCTTSDTMQLYNECNSEDITEHYSCHGDWSDGNGTDFVIASPKDGTSRYCFIIRDVLPSVAGQQQIMNRGLRSVQLAVTMIKEACNKMFAVNTSVAESFRMIYKTECDGSVNGATNRVQFIPALNIISCFSFVLISCYLLAADL